MSDQNIRVQFGAEPGSGPLLEELQALIVIDADGNEGLAVIYVEGDEGMERRVTFVAPTNGPALEPLRDYIDKSTPPPGGRFEWRRFRGQRGVRIR